MKIVLYDNQKIILDELVGYLSQIENVTVIGKATQTADLIALLKSNDVDILITEIMNNEELGLDFFEELQSMNLKTKVIAYSHFSNDLINHFLHEYGVVAIVNKCKGLAELWQVVEFIYLATLYKIDTSALSNFRFRQKKKEVQSFWNFGQEGIRWRMFS
jgi:DNA-binding NarL/FixJ family response regulator